MKRLPLEGVRVCDLTRIWAGPVTTLWLGVMGAEVIKIESTIRPDTTRRLVLRDGKLTPTLDPRRAWFTSVNYSKKAITLNMTDPRASELAKEIVKISDVIADNFATGVMERFGLGYSDVKRLRPDIIMLSTSGYGRTGPEKDYLAYATTVTAFGGLNSLTGYCGGLPNRIGGAWGDLLSAKTGAFAVLAALHHRERTGEGQLIDLSMGEVIASLIPEGIMDYVMNKEVRGLVGNRDDIMAPHGCYPCQGQDKWVAIAVRTEEEWYAFCNAIGDPDWTREERFSDAFRRWKNQEELDKMIGNWTRNYTPYEVMEILQKAGVAAGPSVNLEELANDPHLKERGVFMEIDNAELGKGVITRLPGRLGDGKTGRYEPAPVIGEHNHYVFCELLGMSEGEFNRLVGEKVIY